MARNRNYNVNEIIKEIKKIPKSRFQDKHHKEFFAKIEKAKKEFKNNQH